MNHYVGCDIGAKIIKAVVINDDRISGMARRKIDNRLDKVTMTVINEALSFSGLKMRKVTSFGKTGREARSVKFNGILKPKLALKAELLCIAKAINFLDSDIRTIIDIGALGFKVVSIDQGGNVLDSIANEKCASGGGRFLENISRNLETTLDEMGPLAIGCESPCGITNQCIVFAESEVISLINKGADKKDIIAGIISAVTSQVASAARRGKLEKEVVFIGGSAQNEAVHKFLEDKLETNFRQLPIDSQYVSALGAALMAKDA